jgi:hypothetical protein
VLERDGKRLAEDVGRSVVAVEKLARRAARGPSLPRVAENPPCPPAPAAGAAAAQDRDFRTAQDLLDEKLSVTR